MIKFKWEAIQRNERDGIQTVLWIRMRQPYACQLECVKSGLIIIFTNNHLAVVR